MNKEMKKLVITVVAIILILAIILQYNSFKVGVTPWDDEFPGEDLEESFDEDITDEELESIFDDEFLDLIEET